MPVAQNINEKSSMVISRKVDTLAAKMAIAGTAGQMSQTALDLLLKGQIIFAKAAIASDHPLNLISTKGRSRFAGQPKGKLLYTYPRHTLYDGKRSKDIPIQGALNFYNPFLNTGHDSVIISLSRLAHPLFNN